MYWTDFRRFIERNAQPAAKLYYRRPFTKREDQILICDWDYPRRNGKSVIEGWSEHDWYLQTKVIDCAWLQGEIPLKNRIDDSHVHRGTLSTLQHLLQEGVLLWTDEVRDFFYKCLEPAKYAKLRLKARSNGNHFGWGCPAV